MKDAAAEYMSNRAPNDVPPKSKWTNPGSDSSFMLKLFGEAKNEITAFLAPSRVPLNYFFYHVTKDYADRLLKKQEKGK